jgi:hypothetical protein
MKDAASLIYAIALLLGIVAVVSLAIRPPAAIREFTRGLREIVAAITHLKVGNIEAEMRHSDAAVATVTGTLPSIPSTASIDPTRSDNDTRHVTPSHTSPSTTDEVWRAVWLANERKYDEALSVVQELPAEVDATRIWRIAFIQYISANEGEKAFPALRQTLTAHKANPSVRILVADALAERGEVSALSTRRKLFWLRRERFLIRMNVLVSRTRGLLHQQAMRSKAGRRSRLTLI